MQEIITIQDIINKFFRKSKKIILITLIIALIITGAIYAIQLKEKNNINYEVKIVGLKEYNNTVNGEGNSLELYEFNSVEEIYKSDVIKNSLINMDINSVSNKYITSVIGNYNNIEEEKTKFANAIFNLFTEKAVENTSMFYISYTGNDLASCEYIANYIFNQGRDFINSNFKYISVKYLNKDVNIVTKNYLSITKIAIISIVATFVFVFAIFLFLIIINNRVLSKDQIKAKYNIDILKAIQKEEINYKDISKILLYKLNKKSRKSIVFLSSIEIKNNNILYNIKQEMQNDGYEVSIINESDLVDKDYIENEERNNDYILFNIENVKTSKCFEDIIIKNKNVIILEKIDKSSFSDIDLLIERIKLFDGEIEGFIIEE